MTDSTLELQLSLANHERTNASVTSLEECQEAVRVAINYWINTFRGQLWATLTVALSLEAELMEEADAYHLTRRRIPEIDGLSLLSLSSDRTLFIYETDLYTPRWVHDAINHAAGKHLETNRILQLIREDNSATLQIG